MSRLYETSKGHILLRTLLSALDFTHERLGLPSVLFALA